MTSNALRDEQPIGPLGRAAKRGTDIVIAVIALVLLAPVFFVIAILIRAKDGPPAVFRQMRPGLRGKPFSMAKFRTMRHPRPDEVYFLTDVERTTRLGRFLRSSSLDEIPELWNVLKGDMSIVGPRPLLMEYMAKYTAAENRRHLVRPGMTGWAQVRGRQNLRFAERLAHDVWYVDHWSFWLDLRIMFRTVWIVLSKTGYDAHQKLDEVDDIGLSPNRTRER